MPAYCFFDVLEVTDPEKLERYRNGVLKTVELYGGRYLLVGGKCDIVEGQCRPGLPVLIDFPSLEQAHPWYDSNEYRELKALRLSATKCKPVFMESEPNELTFPSDDGSATILPDYFSFPDKVICHLVLRLDFLYYGNSWGENKDLQYNTPLGDCTEYLKVK